MGTIGLAAPLLFEIDYGFARPNRDHGEDAGQSHGGGDRLSYCSFRASTTAPRMATRMRTEVTSNGSRSLVKRTLEISAMLLPASLRRPPRLAKPSALPSERKTKLSRQKMAAAPGKPAM